MEIYGPTGLVANLVIQQTPGASSITSTQQAITMELPQASTDEAKLEHALGTCLGELESYGRFNRGWDGYRGEPFDHLTLDRVASIARASARFFLAQNTVPSEITPGPASDGTVDLEMVVGNRRIVLTFATGTEVVDMYRRDESGSNEETLVLDGKSLVEQLLWLTR